MKLRLIFCSFFLMGSLFAQDDYTTTNELSKERSPYLLQHAKNPVAWKTWAKAPFEAAKNLDRLVVVSVGYASCHWCHVMEEESFENPAVAAVMNEHYINIKVDREERPDVDQSYMTALRLMGADGGWPLNVITLPNGSPVYAGTYHSKSQWISVLEKMQALYEQQPQQLRAFAADLQNGILAENSLVKRTEDTPFSAALLDKALAQWQQNWDQIHGGNLGDQKFPRPNGLMFLMDYAQLSQHTQTATHLWNTLDNIAASGLYDQLSGGFFRYSTDATWKVPHFEKMLYDNAQMIALYAKAYKLTKKERYARIVRETLAFMKTSFRSEKGGYIATMDADLEGEEGAYYRWTPTELGQIITKDWPLFSAFYRLDPQHLWEGKYHVLQKETDLSKIYKQFSISPQALQIKELAWRKLLRQAQQKRGTPAKDTKIISSWNALMVTALVEAYEALGTPAYLEEAKSLFGTLLAPGATKITHTAAGKGPVFSEDYAYLSQAALRLYFVSAQETYLHQAQEMMKLLDEKFYDKDQQMYFFSQSNDILQPLVKIADGVIPSDNAVAAWVNFLLGHINDNKERTQKAEKALMLASSYMQQDLNNYTQWASFWLAQTYPYYELAIVGNEATEKAQEFLSHGLANVLVSSSTVPSSLPLFEFRYAANETLLYVCENYTCKAPVQSVGEALKQIKQKTVIKPF